jgi:outer membrane protein W
VPWALPLKKSVKNVNVIIRKKMKKLIIVALVASATFVNAQDKIVLKNGDKIQGKISNFESGKSVSIVSDSITFTFKSDEVKKMKLGSLYNEGLLMKTKGFYNETSMGFMLGNDRNYNPTANFTFQMLNGYSFGNKLSVGLGMGIESWSQTFKYPFYANAKYFLRESGMSPYIGLSAGYTITSFNDNQDNYYYPYYDYAYNPYYPPSGRNSRGVMGGVQLGVRKLVTKNFGLTFATGLRYQRLVAHYNYDHLDYIESYKDVENLYRVEFRVGLLFR